MASPREVFISHASQDRRFVTRLVKTFESHSIATWYSRTNILGAQQWHDEIGAALRRCDWFALILSPQAVESVWVKRELLFALQQNRFEDRIIPLRYQASDYEQLSWVLSSFQHIDFQKGFDEGCHDLLRIWNLEYQPNQP